MNQILKRLGIIKTSIEIDDEEIIELQVMKLEQLDIDWGVKTILVKLENSDFSSAVVDIENYLNKYSGVVEYVDTEVQGLKLELKALEAKLQNFSELKNEYLNDIEEFNTLYNLRLGSILKKILKCKEEIAKKALKEKEDVFEEEKEIYEEIKKKYKETVSKKNRIEKKLEMLDEFDDEYDELYEEYKDIKDELDQIENDLNTQRKKVKGLKDDLEDDPINKEYQETKNDYTEFTNDYEEVKQKAQERFEINDEQKKELKLFFRKASKMCHPDIVIDELKEQADEIMKSLNDAYSNKDLEKVKEIFYALENGTGFEVASDSIDDKEILKSKVDELRRSISDIDEEIESIKIDETFITIQSIDDLDNYFDSLKKELEEYLNGLKSSLNSVHKKIIDSIDVTEENEEVLKSKLNVIQLQGNWVSGWAYDLHTLSSEYLGQDEHGHDRYNSVRSEMGELVYKIKYQHDSSVIGKIVDLLQEVDSFEGIDYIIPIPPSNKNRRVQPVFIIAKELGKRFDIPVYCDMLEKSMGAQELKEITDFKERQIALENSMHINNHYDLFDKNILLIDDLYRSGSTLNVATKLLYSKTNVKNVYVLTMTKTRSNR